LRLSNAEPASWPKTNEASCGSNTAKYEWHLPAGTQGERRKVLFSEKNEDIEQLLQPDISCCHGLGLSLRSAKNAPA